MSAVSASELKMSAVSASELKMSAVSASELKMSAVSASGTLRLSGLRGQPSTFARLPFWTAFVP
jgi:hypothetical protein